MQVRPATVADADGIAAVHVRAWQEAYAHLIAPERLAALTPADRVARWTRILENGEEEAWVAVDETVVGWVTASERDPADHPRGRELNGIYSLARVHGSGVGQQLLEAALGERPAFLWSAADNPRAAAFYRRNGFALDGERMTYSLLDTPVDIVRWVR